MIRSAKSLCCLIVLSLLWGACAPGVLLRYSVAPGDMNRSGVQRVQDMPLDSATIYFTPRGFASVFAADITSAVWTQGWLYGGDRLFQMDLLRHIAYGRLTEWAGGKVLNQDRLLRRLDLAGMASAQVARLSGRSRSLFDALAEGINAAALANKKTMEYVLLGQDFAPWQVTDSLAVLDLMSWTFSANLRDEILGARLLSALGSLGWKLFPTGLPQLRAGQNVPIDETAGKVLLATLAGLDDALREGGSNNWAVAATRSASGAPMLANDPHLVGNLIPSLMYPLGLHWQGRNAVGFGVPGMPGILAGRNNKVAWGLTNNYGDVQDLVIETVSDDGESYELDGVMTPFKTRSETYVIRANNGDVTEVTEIVRETVRGPIVTDVAYHVAEPVSLVWTPRHFPGQDLQLAQMMEADNADQLLQAAQSYHGAPMNLVYADSSGRIGHQVIGVVPLRRGTNGAIPVQAKRFPAGVTLPYDEIIPVADLPSLGTQRGWVGTANQNITDIDYPYPYSSRFAPIYRYRRMEQLFAGKMTWRTEDSQAAQLDDRSWFAEQMLPVILQALEGDAQLAPLYKVLKSWDGSMDRDLVAPTLFHEGIRQFVRLSLADDLTPELLDELLAWPYFYHEKMMLSVLNGTWLFADNRTTPKRETAAELFKQGFAQAPAALQQRYGKSWNQLPWGEVHQIYFRHPFKKSGFGGWLLGDGPHPMSGDADTLMRAGGPFDKPWQTDMIAAVRFVVDLGNACWMSGTAATGQSGRWRTAHYSDQVEGYLAGQYQQWPVCEKAAKESAADTLILKKALRVP